jgi:cytoskeletal protein CcmA (bactofilin family)
LALGQGPKRDAMSSSLGIRMSLEDRVIWCAGCDAAGALSLSPSGNLVCSTCGSDNWMYFPLTAKVRKSVSIKGELVVEEDLAIEGCVEGRIELQGHSLWISPEGEVNAVIRAKSVIIAGTLIGEIHASEMVEIKSSGSVRGTINCPRVAIVDGAKFKGSVNTDDRANARAPSAGEISRVLDESYYGRVIEALIEHNLLEERRKNPPRFVKGERRLSHFRL